MRVDFHAHTKKCKDGDGEKRIINPSNFVQKMKKNDVVMCAITNHNKFFIDEYQEIKELDPDLVIFPGIELDVIQEENHYHCILICDPNVMEKFAKSFDNDVERNPNSFVLQYFDFLAKIKEFDNNKIIIIPHFFNKQRGFSEDEAAKLKADLDGYVVILEPANVRSMSIVNNHSELSLIGSDIKDWSKYTANELPEIKVRIENFAKFHELASEPFQFINTVLNAESKLPIQCDSSRSDAKVEIFDDINIIFGEKGSGKTVILRDYIRSGLQEHGKTVVFHEGSKNEEEFTKLKESFISKVSVDEQSKKILKSAFHSIVNYYEPTIKNFIKEYLEYYSVETGNTKAKLVGKKDATYSETLKTTFVKIHETAKTNTEKIMGVREINNNFRETSNESRQILDNELIKLSEEMKVSAVEKYKSVFMVKATDIFLSSLKNSISKNTGSKTKPNNIGFSKLVADRLNFLENLTDFNKELKKVETEQIFNLGSLPHKGEVGLSVKVVVLKKTDTYTNSVFEKSGIVQNRDLLTKIDEFMLYNFANINSYFTPEEKKRNAEEFLKGIIKKEYHIKTDTEEDYKPSDGEKAILSISGILEDNSYECYLFDEIERGLGNKYISDYLIPKLKELRENGKTLVLSTHNANIAINTLPAQEIYCDYEKGKIDNYYTGNMYENRLIGTPDTSIEFDWESKALIHLEGSQEMFNKRRGIYGN